jgi:hypothetical protein
MLIDALKDRINKMTDDELITILADGKDSFQPGIYDLYLDEARKRKIELTDEKYEAVKDKENKKENWNIIRLGYALAVLGGFLGIITAIYVLTKKIRNEKDELVYKFEEQTKKHGKYIIAINCGMMIVWFALFRKIIHLIF